MKQYSSFTFDKLSYFYNKLLVTFAAKSHKHTKSEITDFPTIPTKTSQLTNDSGFKTTDTTYSNMKGATTSAAGSAGLVPAPATGAANRYLRSDGTWQVPPDNNTTYGVATTSANGLMSSGDKSKLDGIATGANKTTVDSSLSSTSTNPVQNKVVNAAITSISDKVGSDSVATQIASGTSGFIKGLSVSGKTITYTKGDNTTGTITTQDTNTTYSNMKGATTSAAGSAGLVPAPATGAANRYLRSDGTWSVPPDNNTTYSNMKGATTSAAGKAGLVPAPAAGKQGSFLRGDGTWATPANTTYAAATTSAAGLMSSSDKSKLDGIATGATKVTVDSALSSTSTNPVQNKVVNSALSGKATRKTYTATLGTSWSGTGPYTQTVTVSGILATDTPHITPNFSSTTSTAISEKESWDCVSRAVSAANSITFTCFDDKPTISIPLSIEVIR